MKAKQKREPFFKPLEEPVTELNWDKLGISPKLVGELRDHVGFAQPTTVQSATIPVLLAQHDALVRARTGSGKTLAYLIPIIQDLVTRKDRVSRTDGTFALILAPTRELVLQIFGVLTSLLRSCHWIVPGHLTGGEKRKSEKARLRKGITVLISTPGRLLDHLETTSSFGLANLQWIVLDEADRLLDLGFEKKVARIVHTLHERQEEACAATSHVVVRRNVLVSATLTEDIEKLASISLRRENTVFIDADRLTPAIKPAKCSSSSLSSVVSSSALGHGGNDDDSDHSDLSDDENEDLKDQYDAPELETPDTLMQFYTTVPCKSRLAVLLTFLRERMSEKVIVFVSNRDSVEFHYHLFRQLALTPIDEASRKRARNPNAPEIPFFQHGILRMHGSMSQLERKESFERFRASPSGILICTDVAARGWDLPELAWVVQYDPPDSASEYIHRVGRTARAGAAGSSIIFLMPAELGFLELLKSKGVTLQERSAATMMRSLASIGILSGAEVTRLASKNKIPASEVLMNELQLRCERLVDGVNQLDPRIRQRKLIKAIKAKAGVVDDEGSDDEEDKITLKDFATRAFGSAVRAYATHSLEMKPIFHPKQLHLGHYAKSFALREAPTKAGTRSVTLRSNADGPSKAKASKRPTRHSAQTLRKMDDKHVMLGEFAAN